MAFFSPNIPSLVCSKCLTNALVMYMKLFRPVFILKCFVLLVHVLGNRYLQPAADK